MLAEWYGCNYQVVRRCRVQRLLSLDETTRRVMLGVPDRPKGLRASSDGPVGRSGAEGTLAPKIRPESILAHGGHV
jgi:hypothetical protein